MRNPNLAPSIFALCLGMQLTVLLGQALSLLSVASAAYDACLYAAFIIFSVVGFMFYQGKAFSVWLFIELVVSTLLLSAVFKSTIYDNSPQLAQSCIVILLIICAIIKIFPQELSLLPARVKTGFKAMSPWATWIAVVLIAAFIYVPDLERVVAMDFIGEQAHHLDFFIMSPGWGSLNGQLPYVNVISQYGVGIPHVLSRLSFLFGGFDYLGVLRMMVFFSVVYCVLFYFFTRAWLNNAVLAFAAFLVFFRLNMFHYGVSPLCLIYPSSLPLRFGLDVLWLWLLWRHLISGHLIFLLLAAAYSGFAVYYMTSSGICIVLTFLFYCAGMWIWDKRSKEKNISLKTIGACVGICVLSAFVSFWLTLGPHIFSAKFWSNCMEYMSYFANGRGALPIHESLKYRNFWVGFMALGLPLVYIATAIMVSVLLWFKKIDRKYFLVVVIAVYGLINYQYFVVRSAMTSYYLSAMPFVLVCAFWVPIIVEKLKIRNQSLLYWSLVVLAGYALLTNHNYISYPNIFNLSPNPMVDTKVAQLFPDRQGYFNHQVKHIPEGDKVALNAAGDQDERIATEFSFKNDQELKAFVAQEYDFSQDVKLIEELTRPNEHVAIVSSFETKILIQAKRPLFFYHTPLLTSQPMRTRYFPNDAAHSPNFLKDTIEQLQTQKPRYVFLENVFLQDSYPDSYKDSNANVLAIVAYIRQNYVPYKKGQYLTAMVVK